MTDEQQRTADEHHMAAIAQARAGQHAQALALCDALVSRFASNAAYWNTRGVALRGLGRAREALESYGKALALNPQYAAAHANLANQLADLQRWPQAVTSYRNALSVGTPDVSIRLALAAVLQRTGALDEALEVWKTAGAQEGAQAQDLQVQTLGGGIYFALGRYAPAHACWARALALEPAQPGLLADMALLSHKMGGRDEALGFVQDALRLEPGSAWAQLVRLTVTQPVSSQARADGDAAMDAFAQRLQELRHWAQDQPERQKELLAGMVRMAPFELAYWPGNHRDILSAYGDFVAQLAAVHVPVPGHSPGAARSRIRVAVVSTHICRHSVWDMVLKGLMAGMDRSKFEVLVYMLAGRRDEQTELARSQADGWRDVAEHGQDPAHWVAVLAADAPDVIFYPELGMNGLTYLLASLRIAPVQAAGWGHPQTSGLANVDLYFSAELFEAADAQDHYREKLVRLPATGCVTHYDAPPPPPHAADLAALVESIAGIRMLLPHAPFKLTDSGDELLVRIALECPDARFIFVTEPSFAAQTALVMARIAQAFRAASLEPTTFLCSVPWQSRSGFARLLELCDIYLDWPGFSGYTTAWHALHRGLPVVTLEGRFMRQRLAAGLLRSTGLQDGVALTAADYVARVCALAVQRRDDTDAFAARRRQIRKQSAQADGDTRVAPAFQETIAQALRSVVQPAALAAQPWDLLDDTGGNHWQALRQDYVPVGLLEMLDITPALSLDVGCFVGATSEAIKHRFPQCRTIGIEPSERAAQEAGRRVDVVHRGMLEEIDLAGAGYGKGCFDLIVMADVLEHMYNPWGAIKLLKPLLSPGGCLLASIPNARNLHVLGQLAQGRFQYEAAGLLDITHIRFFTLLEVRRMFESLGFTIELVRHNTDARWRHLMDARQTTRTVRHGNMLLSDLSPGDVAELATLQFYIRARPVKGQA